MSDNDYTKAGLEAMGGQVIRIENTGLQPGFATKILDEKGQVITNVTRVKLDILPLGNCIDAEITLLHGNKHGYTEEIAVVKDVQLEIDALVTETLIEESEQVE